MKSIKARTKVCLYVLLAVLTAVFACVSFRLYSSDFETRLKPQIERTIVQVSRLLPQLEESEAQLRMISSNLERNREMLSRDYEGLLDDEAGNDSGDLETVVGETLSWMNYITGLQVGREGHVIVVSQEDYTILAHPDKRFVGERMRLLGRGPAQDAVANLESWGDSGTQTDMAHFSLFFPDSFFRNGVGLRRFSAAMDAGVYGSAFSHGDTLILCGTTLMDALRFIVVRCFFSTLFFFAIVWVFVRYIGFAMISHKEERKTFCKKLISYGALAVIAVFCVIWYYQTVMDATGDIATAKNYAETAVETLNSFQKSGEELSDWLDRQYLELCRFVAQVVSAAGKENLTRKGLADLSEDLGVEAIYVYDQDGKVLVTNSPYDHVQVSQDEGDRSYAFRPLLEGREYVIQDVQTDDYSGEKMQYIGVSIRNAEDLCDGFVQIAVNPWVREWLLEPVNVQTVLDNLVLGLPEYALAIDRETGKIVAATDADYKNKSIEDLDADLETIKDDFNGYLIIDGTTYYTAVEESDALYLIPLVRGTGINSLAVSCKLAILCIVSCLLLALTALSAYRQGGAVGEDAKSEAVPAEAAAKDGGKEDEEWSLWGGLPKAEEKYGFDARWKKRSAIPLEEQTPEMRTGGIIYRLLLIFSTAFVLFEAAMIYAGTTRSVRLEGFSYVLLGNWEKGVHLFSISFCLFLFFVLNVVRELLNQVLYRIAKVSDLKRETVLLLLRNALKYACALAFLYIGLAKFGIDTRALWASAGVLSLMVGFGAKDLIGDIIAGLFMIFEGTYKVGDWVTVGSWSGTVQEIGLRSTKISNISDTKVFNNSSIRDVVKANGEVAKAVLKVPIPYETDLLEIEKLLARELPIMAQNIPGLAKPPQYQGVNSFEDSCVMVQIVIFCDSVMCSKALRALRREIKLLFDRKHINIPYNHVVVSDYREELNTYVDVPEPDTKPAEEGAGGASDTKFAR